jgi:hypothetical protein
MGRTTSITSRQAARDWARQVLDQPERWVLLDSETTGIGPAAEFVQLGILIWLAPVRLAHALQRNLTLSR